MKIRLSAIASNKTTNISVDGETITVDDVPFDLSSIPDGGQVEASLPAMNLIKRVDGIIEIAILYHYNAELAEPIQSSNIDDYVVDVISGPVVSPINWLPVEPIINTEDEE